MNTALMEKVRQQFDAGLNDYMAGWEKELRARFGAKGDPAEKLAEAESPPEDAPDLAAWYASLANDIAAAGDDPSDLAGEASDDLASDGWSIIEDGGKWRAAHESEADDGVEKMTEKAPKGGIDFSGRHYKGGQWIPNKEIEKASAADKAKLAAAKADSDTKTAGRKQERAGRGSVDAKGLGERLGKHAAAHELSGKEKGAAASIATLLHRHHGELALHRVEELADRVERTLKTIGDNHPNSDGLRQAMGKKLAQLHIAAERLQGKGVSGQVKPSKVEQTPAHSPKASGEEKAKGEQAPTPSPKAAPPTAPPVAASAPSHHAAVAEATRLWDAPADSYTFEDAQRAAAAMDGMGRADLLKVANGLKFAGGASMKPDALRKALQIRLVGLKGLAERSKMGLEPPKSMQTGKPAEASAKHRGVMEAVEELAADRHGLVSIHALQKATDLPLPELHSIINDLRKQGKLTGTTHEGRQGIPADVRAAALPEPSGNPIHHVSVREPEAEGYSLKPDDSPAPAKPPSPAPTPNRSPPLKERLDRIIKREQAGSAPFTDLLVEALRHHKAVPRELSAHDVINDLKRQARGAAPLHKAIGKEQMATALHGLRQDFGHLTPGELLQVIQHVDYPSREAEKGGVNDKETVLNKRRLPVDVHERISKHSERGVFPRLAAVLLRFSEGGGSDLHRIPGIELFADGEHRGKDYGLDDLRDMVRNFEEYSVPQNGKAPRQAMPLVIGHSEDQSLLERSDVPAAGWFERLYIGRSPTPENPGRRGLFGDAANVPGKVARLIKSKAFPKVSLEIYPPELHPFKGHGMMARRAAMLGGDIPQVKDLDDIPAPEPMSERAAYRPTYLRFSESHAVRGALAFFSEVLPMDPEQMKQKLVEQHGLEPGAVEKMHPDVMAEVCRKMDEKDAKAGMDDDKADGWMASKLAEDAPEDDEGKEQYRERAKKFKEFAAKYGERCKMDETPVSVVTAAGDKKKDEPVKMSEIEGAVAKAVAAALAGVVPAMQKTKVEFEKFAEQEKQTALAQKRATVKATIDTDLKRLTSKEWGRVPPAEVDDERRVLMKFSEDPAVYKFSEGGKTVERTEYQQRIATLERRPNFFAERIAGGAADAKVGLDREKEKIKAAADAFKARNPNSKQADNWVKGWESFAETAGHGATAEDFLPADLLVA